MYPKYLVDTSIFQITQKLRKYDGIWRTVGFHVSELLLKCFEIGKWKFEKSFMNI